MFEAEVYVDGVRLTDSQVTTLRVALSSFLASLDTRAGSLGNDRVGQAISAGYREAGRPVEAMLVDGANRPDRLEARRRG